MKRLILFAALALALPGCSTTSLVSAGAHVADAARVPPPVVVASRTTLDEQGALAVELAYKAARIAVEAMVDAGAIKGERAAQVAALDNRAFLAVTTARSAYAAGNATSYGQALLDGRNAVSDLLALTNK